MKQLRNLLTTEAQTTNNRTSDLELQNDSALLVLVCETKTDRELMKWLSDNALIVYRCCQVILFGILLPVFNRIPVIFFHSI